MNRLVIASMVLFVSAPFASAMSVQSKNEPGLVKNMTRPAAELTRAAESKHDLMITAETEIKVDGRVCGLDQIPAGAEVILLEVGSDRSVIRKIHFQTRK